jgi:hypothetical protein
MKRFLFLRVKKRDEKGYILLLSVLLSSIILAISLGVYSLGLKQFLLSAFLSDSQRALAAADRGIECVMYWDNLFRPTDPLFTTGALTMFRADGSEVLPDNADQAVCSGQQLTNGGVTSWTFDADVADPYGLITPPNGRTRFNLTFSDNTCVQVEVLRNVSMTRITSDGYSDCNVNNPRRTMRRIEAVSDF